MGDLVQLHDDDGSRFSGGELRHGATETWGIELLSRGGRAHFWRRVATGYRRECDGQVVPAFLGNGQCPIFGAGNFRKCKRCMTRLTQAG